jgi:hypothetical protein
MTVVTKYQYWPRHLETWALEIIVNCNGDWQLLSKVEPNIGVDCYFAHIPKSYPSTKGSGTWDGIGFFSYPCGAWVSDPSETYWRAI